MCWLQQEKLLGGRRGLDPQIESMWGRRPPLLHIATSPERKGREGKERGGGASVTSRWIRWRWGEARCWKMRGILASRRFLRENLTLNTAAARNQECRKSGKVGESKLNSLDERRQSTFYSDRKTRLKLPSSVTSRHNLHDWSGKGGFPIQSHKKRSTKKSKLLNDRSSSCWRCWKHFPD